ncbi:hypothetical protein EVAR_7066_1 [Eumeta japonica]|uniref:Uncharacterized protein n=1 Tax=Eumeta variegata TaxID=151549 RepID=A0A4C1XA76_EUMVA|nr:hypothetical protein EVAR_7066_1 [Eumeta japonica]
MSPGTVCGRAMQFWFFIKLNIIAPARADRGRRRRRDPDSGFSRETLETPSLPELNFRNVFTARKRVRECRVCDAREGRISTAAPPPKVNLFLWQFVRLLPGDATS